ncbi:MAG: 3'-5' exonuclease [Thaumarchaeota archaeon]|nr:3'-5' exonuclease [Nitrososphaerota archaeon]
MVGDASKTFYREIKPITERYVQSALEVSGLSLDKLNKTGDEPATAMRDFEGWINSASNGRRPVFVAFNATFDWMFVAYYFHRFLGRNPFGISGLDIKAYYMGMLGTSWGGTIKRKIDKRFLSGRRHTHNALDDAIKRPKSSARCLNTEGKEINGRFVLLRSSWLPFCLNIFPHGLLRFQRLHPITI